MVKVAILHEGKKDKSDDSVLLKLLIQDLDYDLDRVEFFGFKCKSNFFKIEDTKYAELKLQIEEELISKVLFVVDADYETSDKRYGGFNNTENELRDIITKLSFSEIADIYVTCDPQTKDGYLESLLLSSIPKKQKECIETFLNCSEFASKENHKSVLNEIYKKAYPDAPFDFQHKNFDELKQKLHNLFK